MNPHEALPSATVQGREIISRRVIDAPPPLVWKAWTEPEQLTQWWGPHGFACTFHQFDLWPGGEWNFLMHGPDGRDYKNQSVFVELLAPERIVLDHLSGPRFRIEATFADREGKTELTFRATFATEKECEQIKDFALEGNRQTLDRLEDRVAFLAGPVLRISRTYAAPVDRVWKAWTAADDLARWWGPKGMSLRLAALDVRPGGIFHYAMSAAAGPEWWGRFVYRDLRAQQWLSFVVSFSDPAGGVTRHPMSATWPLEVLNLVTFSETDGATTISVEAVPIRATEAERRTFEDGFESLRKGFAGTLDQLGDHLARG